MDFKFIFAGKSKDDFIKSGIEKYKKILKKYGNIEISEPKDSTEKILNQVRKNSFVILLDLKGKEFSSEDMAKLFLKWKDSGIFRFDIVSGGAFGFDNKIYEKSNFIWKLSKLTFNHQIVRLVVLEQIYRIMSILNNEKYHH